MPTLTAEQIRILDELDLYVPGLRRPRGPKLGTVLDSIENGTQTVHLEVFSPQVATGQAGTTAPATVASGNLLYLAFDRDLGQEDVAYRVLKVPLDYVGNGSFHIHWTKSADASEQNRNVRWQVSYTVYDGASQNAAAAGTTFEFEGTYLDGSADSSRIVYRSSNIATSGFYAGGYVALSIRAIAPIGTAFVTSEPALVSLDMLYTAAINLGT